MCIEEDVEMTTEIKETITAEEFDKRLDNSNDRLRHELTEVQERVRRLETLIARKEVFTHRLTQILTEIELEEAEIAVLERGLLRPRRAVSRSASTSL